MQPHPGALRDRQDLAEIPLRFSEFPGGPEQLGPGQQASWQVILTTRLPQARHGLVQMTPGRIKVARSLLQSLHPERPTHGEVV